MFYEIDKNNHGLPQNPFKACVVPRPIGWISSQDKQGHVNLAPYSYFNAISDEPPMVMFSTTSEHIEGGPKDTLKNIEETGEFVVNLATYTLAKAVNLTSANLCRTKNEFVFANLEVEPSQLVKPPRVKDSPIHLECLYHQSIQLPTNEQNHINRMIIGKVIGIHIDESVLTDGLIDMAKLLPIARLGYTDYAVIEQAFSMQRPKQDDLTYLEQTTFVDSG